MCSGMITTLDDEQQGFLNMRAVRPCQFAIKPGRFSEPVI